MAASRNRRGLNGHRLETWKQCTVAQSDDRC